MFEAFNVIADDNGADKESRELIARYYPGVKIAEGLGGCDSLISNAKAKRMLGYQPRYRWREFL